MAPRAKFVTSAPRSDARGLDLALNYAVDNHVADVIGCVPEVVSRGEIMALNSVFQQAAAAFQGTGVLRLGRADNRAVVTRSAGFPDSSPWVTSVGGTSLHRLARPVPVGGRLGQAPTSIDWNHDHWQPAARAPVPLRVGGGASHVFAMPGYQAAEVPPSAAMWSGKLRRVEPTLSMVADPQTGVTFSQTYVLPSGTGGSSTRGSVIRT